MQVKYDTETDYDLIAKVLLIPEEFGGRSRPVASGYRGQFFWRINHVPTTDWDATYFFQDDPVGPGEATLAKVSISQNLKKASQGNFPIGMQFCIREGRRVVATAVIIENRLEGDSE